MYFTCLEAFGNALYRSSKKIYCRSDITDYIQRNNWYDWKICAKYGGDSFTYGIFTPNLRELWWFFMFDIWHFTFYNGF